MRALLDRFLESPTGYKLNTWVQARRATEALSCALPEVRRRRVLDVGCGPGMFTSRFEDADYLGVDLNTQYIECARREHPHARFTVGDIREWQPEEGCAFDLVLVNFFLHHLNDCEADSLLRRLGEWLAPGGCLLVHEPLYPELPGRVARLLMRLDRGQHYRPLRELREMIQCGGYVIQVEQPYRQSLCGVPGSYMVVMRACRAGAAAPSEVSDKPADQCRD